MAWQMTSINIIAGQNAACSYITLLMQCMAFIKFITDELIGLHIVVQVLTQPVSHTDWQKGLVQ